MAGILEVLASYIQNMLTEMASDEVHMLLGVSEEIKEMGDKLEYLKKFLADAERRNITDESESVQLWVREYRDAMYDATNILDLCQLEAMEQGPRRDVGCLNPLLFCMCNPLRDVGWLNPLLFCMRNPLHAHDIGNRIRSFNKKLQEIKKSSMNSSFISLGSYEQSNRSVASSRRRRHHTSAELDESSLVGDNIEEDTRNIVEMLTTKQLTKHENNKIMVFAIVGVGGIGKTTLAQKVFNHDVIQQQFENKIWLSINQNFNDIKLLKKAITEAGGDHRSVGNTRGALERALKKALNGKKTLLVMDDVWDHQAWKGVLKTPLVNAGLAHGSCVLVTTRHDTVAKEMMAKLPYHRVNKLELEDAWLLLKKQVVGDENDEAQIEQLKDIGIDIISRCDCLPLAVKIMGGLLRQERIWRRDWQNVLNRSILSDSQRPKDLDYAICLSYQNLKPHLRPCFLHYSLLPKGIVFTVDEVVGMWISEGFVYGSSRDLEEIGKSYYKELIQRNLIEPDLTTVDREVCNMHDVVRSFAHYVARNESLLIHNSEFGISENFSSQKLIRLSLLGATGSETCELEWCSLQAQTSLRALILVGHIIIKPGDSLLAFSNLRTLHVEHANFDVLVESLNQLKHLRYLSIQQTNTSRLPESIGKMKFLQYISLQGSKSVLELPASISKLQQLRCLNVCGTSIKYAPRGFHGLTCLRKLFGFPANVDGDWCSLEELGPLIQLTELSIVGLENVSSSSFAIKARLGEKVRLTFLDLCCNIRTGDNGHKEEGISEKEQQQNEEVFDELCPPTSIENITIEGYFGKRLPRWMMWRAAAPFVYLRNLMMDDLVCCTELPNGLCQLPSLEFLQIVGAPVVKHVGPQFLQPNHHYHSHSQVGASFPRLCKLNLNGLVEWEEWEWDGHVKAMASLEELRLQRCKLRRVPPGLTFHARALKKLCIYDVQNIRVLENFVSVVHLHVARNSELERISNLPKLQKLIIVKCPKMKVLEGMPALQRLDLEDYDIKTVPRYMKDVKPRHLLLYCSFSLLTCIAAGKSRPEWDKLSHIHQVKAFAGPRKWYVMYTRDPFCFETNISRSVIA